MSIAEEGAIEIKSRPPTSADSSTAQGQSRHNVGFRHLCNDLAAQHVNRRLVLRTFDMLGMVRVIFCLILSDAVEPCSERCGCTVPHQPIRPVDRANKTLSTAIGCGFGGVPMCQSCSAPPACLKLAPAPAMRWRGRPGSGSKRGTLCIPMRAFPGANEHSPSGCGTILAIRASLCLVHEDCPWKWQRHWSQAAETARRAIGRR